MLHGDSVILICIVDSMLKKLCVSSLVYPHDLREPFGCLPTTSIVIQVS